TRGGGDDAGTGGPDHRDARRLGDDAGRVWHGRGIPRRYRPVRRDVVSRLAGHARNGLTDGPGRNSLRRIANGDVARARVDGRRPDIGRSAGLEFDAIVGIFTLPAQPARPGGVWVGNRHHGGRGDGSEFSPGLAGSADRPTASVTELSTSRTAP